ncbi:polysaccharide deacetylase family protein [Filimonas effusa]|uniref:Polysaccharide deacetylase family protein n=1 Tax=Filimonas effusa TaxID=2508721 RepID=A0A4Q1DCF2_9BACT|nr:polysaccharide deacetylase family protein [Filimonas effusa]RXK87122.1 polysaccharide deacetylase family protein [Filimonas effusa]
MYHSVNPTQEEAGYLHVPLRVFEAQLQWLSLQAYTTITIADLLREPASTFHSQASKKLVITFDDGYVSLYRLATPLLRKYGFTATLFVTTAAVGAESYRVLPHFSTTLPSGDRPLNWQELKEMEEDCWDIQPHGHEHLTHNMIADAALQTEIAESKRLVELHLQKQALYYAFPYGRYNHRCLQLLDQLGFRAAFTVQPGLTGNTKPFQIPRIEINRFDTIALFQRKVTTGYRSQGQHISSFFTSFIFRNPRLKDWLKQVRDRFLP